jgi:predicted nucleotidyltransferase
VNDPAPYPLRVSPGTQVVVRPRGAGVVVEVLDTDPPSYLVRFPAGDDAVLRRDQLAIRKQAQQASLGPARDTAALMDQLLDGWVIYRCVTGSQAYGLAGDDSDVDVRGVFVAPPELLWSLQGAPDYLERGAMDEAYWELAKFCILALKANPNVLECLNTPLVEHVVPIGQELLGLREAFLSRLVHQTYNGYVLSQFKKLEGDLRSKGAPKWKHVMHLIRLLLSGISVLRDGQVSVDVGEHRDQLLAIKRGEVAWEEVEAWRLDLHAQFDVALQTSPLPELPDYQRVDRFVIDIRRRTAAGEHP